MPGCVCPAFAMLRLVDPVLGQQVCSHSSQTTAAGLHFTSSTVYAGHRNTLQSSCLAECELSLEVRPGV